MARPVRSSTRIRTFWVLSLLPALVAGAFGAGAAQAAGTPVAGSPVARGPDCLVLYKGYFAPAAPGGACVNIITGSADAPAVDVYVDGVKMVENQTFAADVATAIHAAPSGTPRFQVTATGDPVTKTLLDEKVKLAPGQAYEIVLFDPVATMRIKAYPVDVSPLAADRSRVRVINATQDDGTIDSYLAQGPQSTEAPLDPAVTIRGIKVGRASTFRELTWDTDVIGLTVTSVPAGTAPPNDIGFPSHGGPGFAFSYILVGQGSRAGIYVNTRWDISPSA